MTKNKNEFEGYHKFDDNNPDFHYYGYKKEYIGHKEIGCTICNKSLGQIFIEHILEHMDLEIDEIK